MRAEIREILAGIAVDEAEAFLGAGELLRAHSLGLEGTSVLEPYASIFRAAPLDGEEVEALTLALQAYLEGGGLRNAASAAHALGELRDRRLLPWFTHILERSLHGFELQGLYLGQVVAAMGSCGESLLDGTSFSVDEYEKNAAHARRYIHSRSAGLSS